MHYIFVNKAFQIIHLHWININNYFVYYFVEHTSDEYAHKTYTRYHKAVSGILLFNGICNTNADEWKSFLHCISQTI